MAGEYKHAKELFKQALALAELNKSMSPDMMARAVLTECLKFLGSDNDAKQLRALVNFELEAIVETEFVVTRGC